MRTHHHHVNGKSHVNGAKSLSREISRDMKDIRKDIDSLKSNMIGLAGSVNTAGSRKMQKMASDVEAYAEGKIDSLVSTSAQQVERLESAVKAKPGQSVLMAFVAGGVASLLVSRRF